MVLGIGVAFGTSDHGFSNCQRYLGVCHPRAFFRQAEKALERQRLYLSRLSPLFVVSRYGQRPHPGLQAAHQLCAPRGTCQRCHYWS